MNLQAALANKAPTNPDRQGGVSPRTAHVSKRASLSVASSIAPPMCRHILALTLILALILPAPAAEKPTGNPDKFRARVASFQPNTLLEVKTILGTKWKGNLGQVTTESFEVGHQLVRFDEVKSLRDATHMSGPKQAGLAAVFILGGLAVIYLALGIVAWATGGD